MTHAGPVALITSGSPEFDLPTRAGPALEKMMGTRQEHLQWCKQRALAYLPDKPVDALTSMISDLGKHPETESHSAINLTMMLMMDGHLNDPQKAQKHIEGFN